MVRISTVWDKIDDVNTKVFMVRGDEAYARTTNVQISLKDSVSGASNGFVATAIVDVLRDTGNSSITFYDGEDVLTVVDWSYSNSNMEVQLPRLSWDNEHLIWARYNGNTECLKSKSDVVSISKPNPDLTDTTITNTTSVINYTSTDNITITGKLNRVTGSASLQGREISFYADGIFKGTANTSDTSGNVSKNIGTLSNGKHEIAIVFNGDNPLGASEIKFNISVGYTLTILEYPKTFILSNGINNLVKVNLLNSLGDPVPNKAISFGGQSATTDENGVATITNITNVTDNTTMYASYGNYTSNTITVASCTISDISIETDDGLTVNGVAEPLTVKVTGTGTLSNIPITMSGGMSGTYMTTSSGTVSLSYMGDGSGQNMICATVGNFTASVTIDDLIYYAKVREFNNTKPKLDHAKITEESAFILAPTKTYDPAEALFEIPSNHWIATFDLVNFADKNRWGIMIQYVDLDSSFKKGDKITVINDENGTTVKRNNKVVYSWDENYPSLSLITNNGTLYLKCRMFYDNLKIRSLD